MFASLLDDGKNVALVSDAGTPLISDPGYHVVHALREKGHKVVPIPGACALVAALCASGLPTDQFFLRALCRLSQKVVATYLNLGRSRLARLYFMNLRTAFMTP